MTLTSEAIEIALRPLLSSATRFLRELVAVNSHTGNPVGVAANADLIVEQFVSFAWESRSRACQLPGTGEHLVLDSGGDGPVIFLISHLDTVYTAEEQAIAYRGWQESEKIVKGPGVYDIKGGTAMLWLVMRALFLLDEEAFRSVRWIAAWNAAEERLPDDFAKFCQSLSPSAAAAALVFEGDNAQDGKFEILTARSGLARYHLSARGRGAHSGNDHAAGINAIEGLASVVLELATLTDYTRNTTVNVGMINGGEQTNRVPDFAEAFVEIRFRDPAHFLDVQDRLGRLVHTHPQANKRCAIDVEMIEMIPPLVPTPASEELALIWQRAAADFGISLTAGSRSGLSDGNHFADWVPVLDGLGPSGGKAHCIERTAEGIHIAEYVQLETFLPKAALNVAALHALAKRSQA